MSDGYSKTWVTAGTQPFTASGTFTVPKYRTLTVTLKAGIEGLLKRMIPDVTEVISEAV